MRSKYRQANQKALEQKTALFEERQTTKELRKQLDEARERIPASEQETARLRMQHSAALKQLREEHAAALEEQRSQTAALQEKLTQVQRELADERDAHGTTRKELATRGGGSSNFLQTLETLKHRTAAEMHRQQQSNFPNNPPTPTGTPAGTPRDGPERAPSGSSQEHDENETVNAREELRRTKTAPGAVSMVAKWKEWDRNGGSSPLPHDESPGTEENLAENMAAKEGAPAEGGASRIGTNARKSSSTSLRFGRLCRPIFTR